MKYRSKRYRSKRSEKSFASFARLTDSQSKVVRQRHYCFQIVELIST